MRRCAGLLVPGTAQQPDPRPGARIRPAAGRTAGHRPRRWRGGVLPARQFFPPRPGPPPHGRFDGETVECSYHGWRFAVENGQCREIPSLTEYDKLKVERIFAERFPAEEHDGYVWVYLPDPAARNEPVPPAPPRPVFSGRSP